MYFAPPEYIITYAYGTAYCVFSILGDLIDADLLQLLPFIHIFIVYLGVELKQDNYSVNC